MSAAAMANCAAGSSGVGPGVKSLVLRIMIFLVLNWICGTARGRPTGNHRIHKNVEYVANILWKSLIAQISVQFLYSHGNLP
jgi:hypothetical protein